MRRELLAKDGLARGQEYRNRNIIWYLKLREIPKERIGNRSRGHVTFRLLFFLAGVEAQSLAGVLKMGRGQYIHVCDIPYLLGLD